MIWNIAPVELTSEKVRLRSLRAEDIDAIATAIHDPEGWSARFWGMDTPQKIREMLRSQLAAQERHECHPFVYFVGNEVAGISRYLHLFPSRKALEVGGTWVAPKWRRTFVNTEVKNLLLAHAFEQLGCVRVELRVDCLNYASQMNVLRLGATFEGRIRHWQLRQNSDLPDGMLYSITNKEWPTVKVRLAALRERLLPPTPHFPSVFETPRLHIRLYRLPDALAFLELAQRNHNSLVDSFPQTANMQTVGDAQAYIAEKAHGASAGTTFYYGVWSKQTNQQIGQLQVKQVNWKWRSAELGYFLDSDYRRQGIGSEMVGRACDELLEKREFRRLFLRAIPHNEPSMGLARKLGFAQEGILRADFVTGRGECVDLALFARMGPLHRPTPLATPALLPTGG